MHGYIKPKYGNKANLCWRDTDSFIIYVKSEEIYRDLAVDVEKRFDISNYEVSRPLPIGKNKVRIGLMKDKFDGKIMKEFEALRPKIYRMSDKKVYSTLKVNIKHFLSTKNHQIYKYNTLRSVLLVINCFLNTNDLFGRNY